MKQTFFARRALAILMVVFFVVPFALRGARLAVRQMRNDVKDWLPASFDETTQLDWFRDHFLGEQFVVASWEGCTGDQDDTRFRMLIDKFFRELPPSRQPQLQLDEEHPHFDERLGLYARALQPESNAEATPFIGDQLGLYSPKELHRNWGGKNEKWLRGNGDEWYYILPNGDLYHWQSDNNLVGGMVRTVRRQLAGRTEPDGELVASFGPQDGPWYYSDPRRLEASLFKTVVTGPSVLSDLTRDGGPLAEDVQTAKSRLIGNLFGANGEQTCLLITLTDTAKADMRRVIGRGLLGKPRGKLLDLASESGIRLPPKPSFAPPPLDWLLALASPASEVTSEPVIRLGGPAVDNVAIDEEGQITLVRLVGLCVFVGVALSWLSFRSVYVTIIIFFVGCVSAVTSLSIVWWAGSSVDAVVMSMPSLVYVLGLSGAVHIVNYYRDAAEISGRHGAPEQALKHGWRPCTLAAVTTALGLLSLSTSNIQPIKKFGLFSAVGVVATLALLFTYLPSALELWPPGYDKNRRDNKQSRGIRIDDLAMRFWRSVGRFVIRRHALLTVIGMILLAVFGLGLFRINTSIQLLKLFDGRSKIIQDYQWLETNLGNLVPMEIVVRVDPSSMRFDKRRSDELAASEADDQFSLSFLERMEIGEHVHKAIDAEFGTAGSGVIGTVMLASTFAPPLPEAATSTRSLIERGAYSRQLENFRHDFLDSDYLRIEKETDAELWRISLRVQALSDLDYGEFVHELKRVVEPVIAAYHYREAILRQIASEFDGRYRGARICLIGRRQQTVGSNRQGNGESDAQVSGPLRVEAKAKARETEIFVTTLQGLLRNAGLRITDWDGRPSRDDSRSRINCYVMVNDDPGFATSSDAATTPIVDARDHHFRKDDSSSAVATDDPLAGVSAVYTGIVPVVYKAQRTLLQSLIRSTGWAFVMIALVMMALLRSPRAGLVSMIPNVMPVVLIFGAMGWLDVVVDIGTMMTASVAMGVAVDDTIHFLTWFQRGIREGHDQKGAIMMAYDRVATAMTQTTIIGGLGLSIFAFSTFTPTQRFGILMLVLMVTALVGDLIFLPAILAGPLGGFFGGRKKPASKDASALPEVNPTDRAAVNPPHLQSRVIEASRVAPRRTDSSAGQAGPTV